LAERRADTHGANRRFKDTWGGDDAESVEKVHAFFETRFFEQMAPIPGAREALAQLSERFRFVVVTSRQHVIRESTLAWLDTHFPGVFHDVLFGNHWCARRHPHWRANRLDATTVACPASGFLSVLGSLQSGGEERAARHTLQQRTCNPPACTA